MTDFRPRPPRVARTLARWLLSPGDADRLVDALDDEYAMHQRAERGRIGANLWYWDQVLRSIAALRRPRRRSPGGVIRLDLLHLFRTLRRAPLSAAAAVLTLALTVGVGTAIFAVADAVLLRPPPFADPGALFTVRAAPPGSPSAARPVVDGRTFVAWRDRAGPLATLAAYDPANLTLTGLGSAERVAVNDVTPGFLALLGTVPALGRLPGDGDGRAVVLVSHDFWRTRLAGDPDVVGRRLILNGRTHAVIGVLPRDFAFALDPADVWRPLSVDLTGQDDGGISVRVIGRLTEPASRRRLTAALDEVGAAASPPTQTIATPLSVAIAGPARETLTLLAGAAALALLIAFGNLAGLLLVRATDRRRELAVRGALGAGPGEAARQLGLEALTLAALGIASGIVLTVWLTPTVSRFALAFGGLDARHIAMSWRVVAAVSAAGLACAVLCGVLPALGSRARGPTDVLRRGATPSSGDLPMRRALVAGEVALAFVLLVSMGIVGRSLVDLLGADAGFDPDGVLKFQLALPAAEYSGDAEVAAFYVGLQSALIERLGDGSVSWIDEVPLTGDGGRSIVRVSPVDQGRDAVVRGAGPGYFSVMGIPIDDGRPFDPGDDAAAPPRVVLSRAMAGRLFNGASPVGRRVRIDGVAEPLEIVGVAGDVPHRALDEEAIGTVYLSALQSASASSVLVVRGAPPAEDVIRAVTEEVERLDADLPVYRIESMREVLDASPGVPARRLLTAALGAFATLAALLSGIGLFGVAAHDVATRRAELALRMALGADPRRLVGASIARNALVVATGLVGGGILSFWAVGLLAGLTGSPGIGDLLTIVATVTVALFMIGTAAVLPAALRAATEDPLTSLRG